MRVAAGGATSVQIFEEGNWTTLLSKLKDTGLWLIGTDEKASEDLYNVDLTGSVGLVIGSEDKGLRRLTRNQCDLLVRIPTVAPVQSLNVASATGIALFEARRQRRNINAKT